MTVLSFHRPIACAQSAAADGFPSPGALDVLIIERNNELRALLREMLELLGCATRVAMSEEQAIDLCAERAPHLAICSTRLWHCSGVELARRLRELPGLDITTLVAFTGGAANGNASAPFDKLLQKPLGYEALEAFVKPYMALIASKTAAEA